MFVVQPVVPGPVVTYKLKERDGTPLEGSFYKEDVQKSPYPTEPCSAWKRFYDNADEPGKSVGWVGLVNTIVGFLVRL